MEKMIDTIMEMDRKARLREQEAEEYRENQLKSLDGKLREIDENYRAYTAREIEEIARENEERIRQETARIQALDTRASEELEQAYQSGRDAWVAEIVKRTLKGE